MNTFMTIASGFVTGAAMTVPGVSGGSAAMIIGIYDRLIKAVGECFTEPRRNIPLLLEFAAGAAAGILLAARLISRLLTTPAEIPLRFVFLGAVAGGIPLIFRQAGIRRFHPRALALVLSGASAVLLLSAVPEGIFAPGGQGAAMLAIQFAAGLLLAAALVLPGISASHFLYMLGIYNTVMEKISSLDIVSLLPLAVGLAVGIFIAAKLLERLFQSHRSGTFLVILGFMLASLRELVPQGAGLFQTVTGVICLPVGFIPVYAIQNYRSGNTRRVKNL